MGERKLAFRDTFGQAFMIFTALNLYFLALFIGALVDGRPLDDLLIWNIRGEAQVAAYLTVFVLWGFGIWHVIRWFNKNHMGDVFYFKVNKDDLIGYVTAVLICIAIPILLNKKLPEIASDYGIFLKRYGSIYGHIITIQQVIYYLQEAFLVVFLIILFQKSGEIKFKKTNIPYGAMGLIFTWGIFRFVLHPEGLAFTMMEAALYGIFYVVSEKRFYPVFLLIFLHSII